MLKVENVTKYYGNFKAVDNLSFEVKDGEIFGLLGVNGAGKTTTFRMIMRLIDDYEGTITLDNKPIDYTVTNKIGFLTEERSLLTKLTVKEQILFYGHLKDMKEEEILKKLDYWLDRFEVKEYKDKKIKELSKGNQQKIQFISAIINDPKLLILDEPFSGLDPVNSEILKNIIIDLVAQGKYIIMSSHQMTSIEEFCSDILILNKGKTVLQGNLQKIKSKYPANSIEIITNQNIDNYIKDFGMEIEIKKNNEYMIKLKKEDDAHKLLEQLVRDNILLDKFEIKKPTLNDIFIEKVGG